jgi:membrane protease YdiL (CAAX protease family)
MLEHAPSLSHDSATSGPSTNRIRGYWRLFCLGLLGIASLPLTLYSTIPSTNLPERVQTFPPLVLVLLSLLNPLLYMSLAVAIGIRLAPGVQLRSLVASKEGGRTGVAFGVMSCLPVGLGWGLALAVVMSLLEYGFQPYLSTEWKEAASSVPGPGALSYLITGMFYGGITEEILLRWGVLTVLAWAGARLFQKEHGRARSRILWPAIVGAAIISGVMHLPAAAALAPLEVPVALRIITLNGLAGIVYGRLYCKHHLEAAMVAHISTHVGLTVIACTGLE